MYVVKHEKSTRLGASEEIEIIMDEIIIRQNSTNVQRKLDECLKHKRSMLEMN